MAVAGNTRRARAGPPRATQRKRCDEPPTPSSYRGSEGEGLGFVPLKWHSQAEPEPGTGCRDAHSKRDLSELGCPSGTRRRQGHAGSSVWGQPVSLLCLLSGQLPARPVTRGRRAATCRTAAAAPPADTGAGAVGSPPPRPPTPRPAPSTWGTPLVLPRLIMDLKLTQMLSCWMNQLHVKERCVGNECELRLLVLGEGEGEKCQCMREPLTGFLSRAPSWGSGRAGPHRSQALGLLPISVFLRCFWSLAVFPGDLFNVSFLSPGPQFLPSARHSRGLCVGGPLVGSDPQQGALLPAIGPSSWGQVRALSLLARAGAPESPLSGFV